MPRKCVTCIQRLLKYTSEIIRKRSVFVFCFIILFPALFGVHPITYAKAPPADYHRFSVDFTGHDVYGLTYPITYKFSIPNGSSKLKAYKRFSMSEAWVQVVEKSRNDYFNGIEAVRFDYTQKQAYVSISFASHSDSVYLCFKDSDENEVATSFMGITKYYDNREVAVTFTIDDLGFAPPYGGNENFTLASIAFSDAEVWWTVGWVITGWETSNALIEDGILQDGIDQGYLEIASHSRTHPRPPYDDPDLEIGWTRDEIIRLLDLPYKKGSQEYVWCWIEPSGWSDDIIQQTLGEYHYLVSRNTIGTSGPTYYEEWTNEFGLYDRASTTIFMDDDGNSLQELKDAFDVVYNAGGIYHPWGHVGKLGWTPGMKGYELIQYVSGKKDIWYVAFGHLYAYQYASQNVAYLISHNQIADFTASSTSGSEPLSVTFSDASTSSDAIVSWEWDFGDGGTSSEPNPTHVYEEGTYTVSLIVEESDGDSDIESKTDFITVTANHPPPPPPNSSPVTDFEIQSSAKPAINEEILFIDKSADNDGTITSWSWNFGDGNTSVIENPTHKYQSIGTYMVTLTVKDDDGATNTKTKQITIYDVNPPLTTDDYDGLWHNSDLTITLAATDDYSGVAEIYYEINDGPNQQLTINGQPHITTEGANNSLEYWSIDKAGNEEIHHTLMDIKLDKTSPTAVAGQDITVTEDTIMNFNGSNSNDNIEITNYTWIFFDGTLKTVNGANPQYIFHNPGVYNANLTVTDEALNSALDTITITVIDITNPSANAGDDQVVHEGDIVTFDGSNSTDNVDIVSYYWDFIDVDPQHLVGKNLTHTFQSAGKQEVTLTVLDKHGNSATDIVTVIVIDTTWPAANAGPDQIVEEDILVYFDGSVSSDNVGIIGYVWTLTDETLQSLHGVNPSYVFETPGDYVVTLIVSDLEGHSSNDTVTIIVRDITAPTIEVEDYAEVIEYVPINFNASNSHDDVGIANYQWVFGDGIVENTTSPTVMHIYTESGVFNFELIVTDITGNVNGTLSSIVVHKDTDGDSIADHLDSDDDGDAMPDEWELLYDLDPLDPLDASHDTDGDGIINLDEYRKNSDPKIYDFSTVRLSIVLVIAVILSMISFGIVYGRKLQERISDVRWPHRQSEKYLECASPFTALKCALACP